MVKRFGRSIGLFFTRLGGVVKGTEGAWCLFFGHTWIIDTDRQKDKRMHANTEAICNVCPKMGKAMKRNGIWFIAPVK